MHAYVRHAKQISGATLYDRVDGATIISNGCCSIAHVDVATPKPPSVRHAMTEDDARRSVEAFIREFSAAEPDVSAVEDLQRGRR